MTQGSTGRGRKKKEAHWQRIVREQPTSGLSVRAFCARRHVGEHGFYWWRRELTRRDAARPPAFVPVRVAGELPVSAGGRIEIVLPNDRRVQVVGAVDRQMLADVLCVLEQQGGGAMLKLPSLGELDQGMPVRIYLCAVPADMRRGFDTLSASVREFLKHDPFSGNLFLFVSRGKDRMKILYWERDGFALWYKRLEEGSFKLPAVKDAGSSVELKATELAMLLEGIDLKSIKRSKRFNRSVGATPMPGP